MSKAKPKKERWDIMASFSKKKKKSKGTVGNTNPSTRLSRFNTRPGSRSRTRMRR